MFPFVPYILLPLTLAFSISHSNLADPLYFPPLLGFSFLSPSKLYLPFALISSLLYLPHFFLLLDPLMFPTHPSISYLPLALSTSHPNLPQYTSLTLLLSLALLVPSITSFLYVPFLHLSLSLSSRLIKLIHHGLLLPCTKYS